MAEAPRSSLLEALSRCDGLIVRQVTDLIELFGYEAANSYVIEDLTGRSIGLAIERAAGIGAFIGLQIFGHWRRFSIAVMDNERQLVFEARHPFRVIFSRMDVYADGDRFIGAVQRQFSLLSKKFRVEGANGETLLEMSSPYWRPWTFKFTKSGKVSAILKKRWNGVMREAFTDADLFELSFSSSAYPLQEKLLLLAAALFVDVQYFETKAKKR